MNAKSALISTINTLCKPLVYVFYYTQFISQFLLIKFKNNYNYCFNTPTPISNPITINLINYEDKYAKYIKFYLTTPTNEANIQIDNNLYSFSTRKTLFKDPNNLLEKQWKSRILIENTPNGNILMYYDCYNMNFVYYSDMQIIPNKALYYIAMKYVVIYRCRDFFIDITNYPNNKMIDLFKAEDNVLKTKTVSKNLEGRNNLTFSTLINKNYKTKPFPIVNKAPLYSNKYCRINKLMDFNILQKPPNKKIEYVNKMMFDDKPITKIADFFDNIIDDDLEIHNDTIIENTHNQTNLTDYAAYKQMLKLKTVEQLNNT